MGYDNSYDDEEFEEDEDVGTDEQDDTSPCPYCGRLIYDDTERCPYCEQYLSGEDAPSPRPPLWIIAGVIATLAILLMWLLV